MGVIKSSHEALLLWLLAFSKVLQYVCVVHGKLWRFVLKKYSSSFNNKLEYFNIRFYFYVRYLHKKKLKQSVLELLNRAIISSFTSNRTYAKTTLTRRWNLFYQKSEQKKRVCLIILNTWLMPFITCAPCAIDRITKTILTVHVFLSISYFQKSN